MASISSPLPDLLFNGWRLRHELYDEAYQRGDFQRWTVSSLCSAYLQYQLQRYERAETQQSPPSLYSISFRRMLEILRSSTNQQADASTVADCLESTTLQRILQDPHTPYALLRLFDALPSTIIHASEADRTLADIDEAVLASERYIRSCKAKPNHGYLVTLDDMSNLFGPLGTDGFLPLKRRSPPKGGFEFLDQKKKSLLRIHGTDASFIKTFDRVTQGILKGLNWDHVLIAGGMVLNTLLYTDDISEDPHGDIKDCDIDLYLYGLTPCEANRKVEEIYKAWSSNLAKSDGDGAIPRHVVVKNARTINFIPEYPSRRVQIILRLSPSPLDILLRSDLDACALGFDGSRVLMLPRCARAMETGYSTFTMDLIWGHHLGNRRETQEIQVFKYADRGFGLRILPSYVRSLEKDNFGDTASSQQVPPRISPDPNGGTRVRRDRTEPARVFEGEPGLKTLRRIAYLARQFVHRCYFGPSKVLVHRERRAHDDTSDEDTPDEDTVGHAALEEEHAEEDKVHVDGYLEEGEGAPFGDDCFPVIRLSTLDGCSMHVGQPDGARSLGVFEVFMRHCEAWRLDAMGLAQYVSSWKISHMARHWLQLR